jgi:hypothetical protein
MVLCLFVQMLISIYRYKSMNFTKKIVGILIPHFLLFTIAISVSFAKDDLSPLKAGYSNADCAVLFSAFATQTPLGPRFLSKSLNDSVRKVDEIHSISSMQYNVENLFNYQGKYGYDEQGKWVMQQPPKTKPEARFLRLKANIERANPDIMTWQEVENLQAADDFVNTYLDGKYRVILIEGNDSRGIDVAMLVKKDLPFDVVVQSHRELTDSGNKVFSRDFVVAEFYLPNSKDSDEPLFKIMNTHNKSQRDSPGDPRSVKKRTAQVQKQAEIANQEAKEHPEVPAFIVGDLNADVRNAPEFQPLWDIGYKDSFNVIKNTIPVDQRITQSYFPPGGAPVYNQLDGILASPVAQQKEVIKSVEIISDLNPDGTPMRLPRTFREREKQASDHRAIKMEIDFKKIYEDWRQRKEIQ